MKEISFIELIKAHVFYWKNFIQMIINVYRTFSNYSTVLNNALNGKFPINAILKNGKHVSLHTFNAMYILAFTREFKDVKCDVENDLVVISSDSRKKIIFHGGINNGDIVYGVLKKDYDKLPVNEKFVIDIGANIGDTPIYFALHGAKKVIGLEPFPRNYELASMNIIKNDLSDIITILLSGCSSEDKTVTINPNYESNHESKLIEFQKGRQIPLLTLESLFKQYNIPSNSILKMDCEGCENDIILSASKETLQKFSHMQIEYHSGYKTLKEKIEKCGFKVLVTNPIATDVLHSCLEWFKKDNSKEVNFKNGVKQVKNHEIGYTGFLYATNNIKT